jgi:hypothetical protein
MADEKKKPLSLDEVMESVSCIAQEDGHRDQFKALKLLATAQNAAIVLPEPLTRQERMDRLSRIMKGCGREDTQIAFARTFARSKQKIGEAPSLTLDDVTPEMYERVKHVTSIVTFNRAAPEVKKSGVPRGYPKGKGKVAQKAWLQKEFAKILIDREQAELDRQAKLAALPAEDPENPPWMRSRPTPQESL